jgi:DNA-binding transcriptional MocR family regulator
MLDLLHAHRLLPVPVARDADGVSPRALEHALRLAAPRLVYLAPAVHAPTGRATPARRLDELAELLDASDTTVVVDDTLADVAFAPAVAGLAARCRRARVLRVGTLSKSVWAGLRVGWLHAPGPVRERVLRHRARVDLGTPLLSQHVAEAVVRDLDRILAARLPVLRERRDACVATLARRLPAWEVTVPDGGLTVWARWPGGDAGRLVEQAARRGVTVMDGAIAHAAPGRGGQHVRICFDRDADVLDEGLERLSAAVADLSARAS